MAVSAGLAAVKIATGFAAQSTSLLADGFESAGDVVSSGMVFLGLTLAARPPDSNHPYGHGRAEILSGLGLGVLLLAGGVAIAVHAVMGVGDVTEPPKAYAIWPIVVSIGVKMWLLRMKLVAGRRLNSASLKADAYNDSIDMLSGFVALAALGLTLYDPERFLLADHYGAFAIGLIMMFTATRVARETSMQLMDTMPDEKRLGQIREVAMRVAGVEGVEKCYARKTGLQYHVDLHLEVDPLVTVLVGHDIASRARDTIRQELDWVADVLVHVEPAPRAAMISGMDMIPDVVLSSTEAKLVQEPFGDARFYFEGRTDLLKAMTAGSLVLKPGMSPHPPHQHPEEEFMLVTEGTGEIQVGDKVTQVGPGAMMYCAGNTLHGIENTGSVPMTFYFYKWLA